MPVGLLAVTVPEILVWRHEGGLLLQRESGTSTRSLCVSEAADAMAAAELREASFPRLVHVASPVSNCLQGSPCTRPLPPPERGSWFPGQAPPQVAPLLTLALNGPSGQHFPPETPRGAPETRDTVSSCSKEGGKATWAWLGPLTSTIHRRWNCGELSSLAQPQLSFPHGNTYTQFQHMGKQSGFQRFSRERTPYNEKD